MDSLCFQRNSGSGYRARWITDSIWLSWLSSCPAFLPESKGIILGQIEDTYYNNVELSLRNGDRFVLYTDGLVEALNPAGEIFGWDRFKSFIKSNGGLDADQFSDRLLDGISRWSGRPSKGPLDDDLTLMVVDFENAAT
jgi:sigma-B regulation protein RsbU (phosphoserine phosphatase)